MKLLSPPLDESLFNLAAETQHEFMIASPWIKKDALLDNIITGLKGNYLSKVITVGENNDFIQESSDIEALQYLFNNNCDIRLISNLHAKIYISDRNKAIVTSANCTNSGMSKNLEIGILIDDPDMVKELVDIFEYWHKRGRQVKQDFIDKIIKKIEKYSAEFKRIESAENESCTIYKTSNGNYININRKTNINWKNEIKPLSDSYNWREATRNWEYAQKHSQYVEDWICFFETAFKNIPKDAIDKAWFGVHKVDISMSIGNMWIAVVRNNLKKVNIIVDKDWDILFKSTKKTPLGLRSYTWENLAKVNQDTEVWNSYSRALEKIWDSPQSRLCRLDYMERKKCVKTFFHNTSGNLLQ